MGNKTVARKDTDPSPNQGCAHIEYRVASHPRLSKGEQQAPAHSAMIAQVSTHKLANINNKMAENLSPVRASGIVLLCPQGTFAVYHQTTNHCCPLPTRVSHPASAWCWTWMRPWCILLLRRVSAQLGQPKHTNQSDHGKWRTGRMAHLN